MRVNKNGASMVGYALALSVGLAAAGCDSPTAATPLRPPTAATATLSGIVRDQSGAPFEPAIVYCQTWSTQTSSNPPGQYRLTGLSPGPAEIKLEAQGQILAQTFPVTLVEGDNVLDLVISVRTGEPASMSGFALLASGEPAPYAAVIIQGKAASVAADGSYALSGLISGQWNVGVEWNYWDNDWSGTVTLNPGANTVNLTVK